MSHEIYFDPDARPVAAGPWPFVSPCLYEARISIQSRECSPELLERFVGSTLFPERPAGAAIIDMARRPNASLLFVSAPAMVDAEAQIDYYLNLVPRSPEDIQALKQRLWLASVDDRSSRWLSEKVVDPANPSAARLRETLRTYVAEQQAAGRRVQLAYFEPSKNLETLAEWLGVPHDQGLSKFIHLGTKAESRKLLAGVGIPIARGTEECFSLEALAKAMVPLLEAGVRCFILKLSSTEFGAGQGNALLDLSGLALTGDPRNAAFTLLEYLPQANPVDAELGWVGFSAAVSQSGVLAEEFLGSGDLRSPSFQGRIQSDGRVEILAAHEQVLAANRQTYVGSFFPADAAYRAIVFDYGLRVGHALVKAGVDCGDYGVDFLAIREEGGGWRLYGCEVNLRATGTKHGYETVAGLLGVAPEPDGSFKVDGRPRVYLASDGVYDPRYRGLRPSTLIDAIRQSDLHYDDRTKTGVVLHILSAVKDYGKFGAVCIAETRERADCMMADLVGLVNDLVAHHLSL